VTTQRDDELREAFQALRAESQQRSRVPDFAQMLQEAKRQAAARPALQVVAGRSVREVAPRQFVRTGAWVSALFAASVAALIVLDRPPSGDAAFERLVAAYSTETAGGTWSSPTSGLLDVPGLDLVRSLPSIGGSIRGLDPATMPPRPSSPEEENL